MYSCTDLHKGEYLSDISNLEETLSEIKAQADDVDTMTLHEMSEDYSAINEHVKRINDTLDLETALLLDEYLKAMRKIDGIRVNLLVIQEDVDQEQQSLSSLRDDIVNAYGKRDKYGDYIHTEQLRVDSISTIFSDLQSDYETVREIFDKNNSELKERLNTFNVSE